jgi:hypothetical protein
MAAVMIANKATAGISTLYATINGSNSQNRTGLITFDNAWTGFQIVFNNLNSDASYRIESVVCLEFNPAVGTAFYNVTKAASKINNTTLQQGETAGKNNEIKTGTGQ